MLDGVLDHVSRKIERPIHLKFNYLFLLTYARYKITVDSMVLSSPNGYLWQFHIMDV
jgi:hypothetical protein